MPRDIAVTCQACLAVNDPADVLTVPISPPNSPNQMPMRLCRLCTLAIMKAAIQSELIDPSEVFGAELTPPPNEAAASEAPGNGAEGGARSSPSAPDAESYAEGPTDTGLATPGYSNGPMPGGTCALDCGRPALDDDIYCGECRTTLRE